MNDTKAKATTSPGCISDHAGRFRNGSHFTAVESATSKFKGRSIPTSPS